MGQYALQGVNAAAAIADGAAELLDAQRQVLESIVRGRPLEEVLAALCRIVESQANSSVRAAILLLDSRGERLWTGAAPSVPEAYNRAIDGIEISPNIGTCCAAASRGEVVTTRSIASDPAWASLRHLPLELGLKAAWSMPIVSSAGRVLGTFGTYFLEEREPSTHERTLVDVLAPTAALAIERQRADDSARAAVDRHRFLSELAAATQPLIDPAEVMSTSAQLLAEFLNVERCAYAEVEDERVFVITGDYSRGVPSIVGRWDVAAFGTACVQDMLEGRAYVVADIDKHERITPEDLLAYRATNIQAVICVPLHKHGKFTAAMAVHQTVPRVWTQDEIDLVTLVVGRCWEALERTRVTRSLRDSEARYRAIVESSPECVMLVSADGTLLQMNAAGLRMVEAKVDRDVIGSSIYAVITPEFRDAFRAFNERVCQGEKGTLEFEITGLKGARRILETTAVPLVTADGGYAQLGMTRDITARVESTRALAEHRARLDYAVRLSRVGFWYCNLPFDELTWDERVKEHFFLPPDARVTIEDFYRIIHEEDRERTRQAIEASIRDHASYDMVYRTVNLETGEIKHIRALGGTDYGVDGNPIHFDGVTVDVTQQKRDQEQVAQLFERELEHARVLKRVADAALKIHASDSVETVLKRVTEEAREIIGAHQAFGSLIGSDQIATTTAKSFSQKYATTEHRERLVHHTQLDVVVCRTNRPVRLTTAQLDDQPMLRNLPSDPAERLPLRGWLAVPFIARDGSNVGLVQLSDKFRGEFNETDEVILVQLAQIAAVALENARLYDQLRDQDRRKDEFLATLAHELRNPLAPIRTGLQVLQLSSNAENAAKTRQMMERQLGHLVRMVDDLLDISRVTLGKLELKKERVDFRAILHSALETARPSIEANGHELALRLTKDPLPLEADPTRLAQVIANLLNNAAKYTPAGGRIQLTAEGDESVLIIRLSDTGIGIPPDMVQRVFDMFTQVGRSIDRAQGGLGIGLTLVRRLVELHGGTIDAESPGVGLGSTFTIRLPLVEAQRESSSNAPKSLARAEQSLRILVVDDNVDAAESLAMLLELSGHITHLAHSGTDALTAARDFAPQVIFLDIGLPGLNGYEVAEFIRADVAMKQPTLIALTGWGAEDDRRRAEEAGFDHHLVKPVETSTLVDILASISSKPPSVARPQRKRELH
jgi:PAS domain S-box-containing protein